MQQQDTGWTFILFLSRLVWRVSIKKEKKIAENSPKTEFIGKSSTKWTLKRKFLKWTGLKLYSCIAQLLALPEVKLSLFSACFLAQILVFVYNFGYVSIFLAQVNLTHHLSYCFLKKKPKTVIYKSRYLKYFSLG